MRKQSSMWSLKILWRSMMIIENTNTLDILTEGKNLVLNCYSNRCEL